MFTLRDESINYGFSKFATFVKLNKGRKDSEKEDALNMLAEALGLDEDTMDHLFERCSYSFEENAPYVVVGALLGVAFSEHASENNRSSDDEA